MLFSHPLAVFNVFFSPFLPSFSHLGEVSDQVAAGVVGLCHDVEQEGLHVVVQSFVVQEQLGQQAQVLAVNLGTEKKKID